VRLKEEENELRKMGGGNAQKSAAARERNNKDKGKTDAERKEASAKAAKDATALVCKICRATFMVNVKPPTLHLHVTAKHAGTNPVECFNILAGYDPEDPKGLKKAAAATSSAGPVKQKKKKDDGFEDLLSVGLTKGKKKK